MGLAHNKLLSARPVCFTPTSTGGSMAKNQNSAEKRRREVEKKFKAEEKRQARLKRKTDGPRMDLQGRTPINEGQDPPSDANA
jgi:hypothetical protein